MKRASVFFKVMGGCVAVTLVGSFLMIDLLRVKVTEASMLGLPEPNLILKTSKEFSYPILRGVKIDYNNPLNMDFIIDTVDQGDVDEQEAQRLVNYFYATVAVPNEALWVNLSPYEQDRVVEDSLKETDLGRDLLAQDYVLKQFSSSLTYPESESGENYWEMIKESNGISDDSFNKIWIMPATAKIYEENGMAWVDEATLTAQLEADYMAAEKNNINKESGSTAAMREIVLPKVIDEINNGKNFAKLRQIYHSMLLGMWFKKRFKESFFANLIEQENVKGIEIEDKEAKEKIYKVYKKAFEQGVYRMLKKEKDNESGRMVKKEYFSGGFTPMSSSIMEQETNTLSSNVIVDGIIGSIKNKITEFGIGLKMLKVSFDEKIRDKAKFQPTPGKGANVSSDNYDNEQYRTFNSYQGITPEMQAEIAKEMKKFDELLPSPASEDALASMAEILKRQSELRDTEWRKPSTDFNSRAAMYQLADDIFSSPSVQHTMQQEGVYILGTDGINMGTSGFRGSLRGATAKFRDGDSDRIMPQRDAEDASAVFLKFTPSHNKGEGPFGRRSEDVLAAYSNIVNKWAGDPTTPFSYSGHYFQDLSQPIWNFMFMAQVKVADAVGNFTRKLKKSLKRAMIESSPMAPMAMEHTMREGGDELYSMSEIIDKFVGNGYWTNQNVYDSVNEFRDGLDSFVSKMIENVDKTSDSDLLLQGDLNQVDWANDIIYGDALAAGLYNNVYKLYRAQVQVNKSRMLISPNFNYTDYLAENQQRASDAAAIVRSQALNLIDFAAYEAELTQSSSVKQEELYAQFMEIANDPGVNDNVAHRALAQRLSELVKEGLVLTDSADIAFTRQLIKKRFGIDRKVNSILKQLEKNTDAELKQQGYTKQLLEAHDLSMDAVDQRMAELKDSMGMADLSNDEFRSSLRESYKATEERFGNPGLLTDEFRSSLRESYKASEERFGNPGQLTDEYNFHGFQLYDDLGWGTSGYRGLVNEDFGPEAVDTTPSVLAALNANRMTPSHMLGQRDGIIITQFNANNKFAGDSVEVDNSLADAISIGLVNFQVKFDKAVNNFRAKVSKTVKRMLLESREDAYVVMDRILKDGGNDLYNVAEIVTKFKSKGVMTEIAVAESVEIFQNGVENFALDMIANEGDIAEWGAKYLQGNNLAEGLFRALANKFESRRYTGTIGAFSQVDPQTLDRDLAVAMAESEKLAANGLVNFKAYKAELAEISSAEKDVLVSLSTKMLEATDKLATGLDVTDIAQMKKAIEDGQVDGLNPKKVDAYVANLYELNDMTLSSNVVEFAIRNVVRGIIEFRPDKNNVLKRILEGGGNGIWNLSETIYMLNANGEISDWQFADALTIVNIELAAFSRAMADHKYDSFGFINTKADLSWIDEFSHRSYIAKGILARIFADFKDISIRNPQMENEAVAKAVAISVLNEMKDISDWQKQGKINSSSSYDNGSVDGGISMSSSISEGEMMIIEGEMQNQRRAASNLNVNAGYTYGMVKNIIERVAAGQVEGLSAENAAVYANYLSENYNVPVYDLASRHSYKASNTLVQRDGGISMQELDDKLVLEKGQDAQAKMFANVDYDFSDGINYIVLALNDITGEQVIELAAA